VLSGDLNGDDLPKFSNRLDNCYHVVNGHDADRTAILDGFTISGGSGDGSMFEDQLGGGMVIEGGHPAVRNCLFTDNYAKSGGAIHNQGASSTCVNCTFTGNVAVEGGAIYSAGGGQPIC